MRKLWRNWIPLLAIVLMAAVVACGSDDDEDSTTATPSDMDAG